MKILVLSSRFPYPIERGDKLRVYHQIREMSKRHEIILCALSDQPVSPEAEAEMARFCSKVYHFRLKMPGIIAHMAQSFISGQPIQVSYFFRSSLKKKIHEIVRQEQPDHVFCQLLRMAEYARDLELPKTLDYMDAFSLGMRRRAERSAPWIRGIFTREARLLKAYEAEIFSDFDNCSIISEQDRDHLAISGSRQIAVIPNGVDVDFFHPLPGVPQDADLVFVGNLGYFPNVEAARFLVKELLPLLPNTLQLNLAGARPSAEVKALAQSRVEVSGWVEDIRNAYARGKVFVAPLFAGSGQQNKILEAMAMGLPCITTPMVNRAIGAEAEKEILLAEDAGQFAMQIQRLLMDPVLAKSIGQAGRRLVERSFSWASSVRQLEKLMEA